MVKSLVFSKFKVRKIYGSKYFKAFIRVVKSINSDQFYNSFGSQNIIEERLIEAKDKDEVKAFLLAKYPQFFPNNKIYSKETKDEAQFFYVVIYELFEYEKSQLTGTSWTCSYCGQQYENTYISKPRTNERIFGGLMFCRSDDDFCLNEYRKKAHEGIELPDQEDYIKIDSPNYIYKVTEKATGKCYIGKTRNAPFFRWWNHLTHSCSPFGIYLRNHTKLSDWTFEVLEVLPANVSDNEIFRIESEYIRKFDSIANGYNSVISNKAVNAA